MQWSSHPHIYLDLYVIGRQKIKERVRILERRYSYSIAVSFVGVGRKESSCTHICEFSAHKIFSHMHPFILSQGDLGLDINYEAYTLYGTILYFLGNNASITCQDCLYLCILATRKVGHFPWACFTEYTANSKAFWSISLKPNFRNVAICIWQYCTIIVE